ncbi:hypothetical protein TKK_0000475 [Trichogramma kaykai]
MYDGVRREVEEKLANEDVKRKDASRKVELTGRVSDMPLGEQLQWLGQALGQASGDCSESPISHAAREGERVAAMMRENRDFINVRVNGEVYRAMYDTGAQVTIVGPRVAEKLRDRLHETSTNIKMPFTPVLSRTIGTLTVQVEIDGRVEPMRWRAMSYGDDDIILGADFKNLWQVDTCMSEQQWRVRGGPWHDFCALNDAALDIFVECAGLSVASVNEIHAIGEVFERVYGESRNVACCAELEQNNSCDDSDEYGDVCVSAGLCELSDEQKRALEATIERLLATKPSGLGLTTLTEHHIDVQGADPIKHHPRRMSPKMLEIAHAEVEKMLADGVIERSASAWSSAPVIVKKADGSNRFCIDYRDLNKVTKKDAYPVPNIDHILDKLRRARYITTIDLKSAYFQIKMEESSKKFTAFAIPGSGLYQFLRLPYGLCNAPASFQRLIDALFGPEFEPHVFGYLDDIIIVTESFDEHMKWLEIVLTKLRDAGLTVNRKKCDFCCSRVKYLGYVLDSNGLRVDSEKVQPVLRYPAPTNVKELRRFLGMVGWYARFIPNDSDLKKPLLELLHKDAEWRWTREHQSAFEALKRAITEAPVLARPDFSKPFVVQCDASDVAIGGVLTQVHEDGEHPIVYVSRVLTPAERNYNTSEKECLALLWAIKKLRPYLEGYRFVAITDHSALQYLRNLKEPTGRLARWALEMQQWDFEVVHRKGKYNELPDALSRVCEIESNDDVVESANVGTMNVCDIDDEAYSARIEEVLTSPERWRNWCVRNGMLYRYKYDAILDPVTNESAGWKLVVPKNHRERVLREAHCDISSGHLGVEKTYERVAREYFWRGMYHDVHEFVRICDACQRYKPAQTGPQGLMGKRVFEEPWTVIAMDCMEFPKSKAQNKYLIVIIDLFTRWVEIRPARAATAKAVISALEELVVFRWGTPEVLITDNGTEFINKDVAKTLEEFGIHHTTIPPYCARTNPTERANRTIKTTIKSYVGADHRNWDVHVHELRYAINTAVQSSTRVSPAFLNFGRHPRRANTFHSEVERRKINDWRIDESVWLDRVKRVNAIYDIVADNVEKAHARQARHYNEGRKDVRFEVGDLVLRKAHYLSSGSASFTRKLAQEYDGPFKVAEVLSPTVYVLEMPNSRRNPKVDVGDLKPYKTSEEKQNRREGEPPRAAGYRTEAWAVAVVEERPSPPAQAQGPPAASWRREPRQQVYPEQYRAPQLSELEMYRRVMERQAQIEAARAEHQRAVEEAYAIELIRARAFARTGPYHQWEGPPRDQR